MVRETLEPRQTTLVLTYDHFGAPAALDQTFARLCACPGPCWSGQAPPYPVGQPHRRRRGGAAGGLGAGPAGLPGAGLLPARPGGGTLHPGHRPAPARPRRSPPAHPCNAHRTGRRCARKRKRRAAAPLRRGPGRPAGGRLPPPSGAGGHRLFLPYRLLRPDSRPSPAAGLRRRRAGLPRPLVPPPPLVGPSPGPAGRRLAPGGAAAVAARWPWVPTPCGWTWSTPFPPAWSWASPWSRPFPPRSPLDQLRHPARPPGPGTAGRPAGAGRRAPALPSGWSSSAPSPSCCSPCASRSPRAGCP